MASSQLLSAELELLQHFRIDNYLDVISLTILVYDYILNFNQELVLVWSSSWTMTKILFILTRYLPFIDISLTISHQFAPNVDSRSCIGIYQATIWMFLTGILVAESILALRTWAIWGRTRGFTITLVILFVAFVAVEFSTMGVFVRSIRVMPPPAGVPIEISPSCLLTGNTHVLVINWAALMVYEAVILGIMLLRGFKIFSMYGNSRLFLVIRRDGVLYYCYIFALSFLNIIIVLTQKADFIFLFAALERVIHSVLTAHIIFHIRSGGGDRQSSTELIDVGT